MSKKSVSKKNHLKLEEVEKLYRMIHKYNLRELAYKQILQFYLEFYKSPKK